MKKNYALFDLIGTSKFINEGKESIIYEFYMKVKAWIENKIWKTDFNSPYQPTLGNYDAQIFVKAIVFSDSLLIEMTSNHGLDIFYKIVRNLYSYLYNNNIPTYYIINIDEELESPDDIIFKSNTQQRDGSNAFNIAFMPGLAWIYLYYADTHIAKKKEWHKKYHEYCVGEKNLLPNQKFKDKISIKHEKRDEFVVYALE